MRHSKFQSAVFAKSLAKSGAFVCAVMNVLSSLRSWLQAGGGLKPDLYYIVQELRRLHCRCPFRRVENRIRADKHFPQPHKILVSDWLAGALLKA